jgi:hypothetical protein
MKSKKSSWKVFTFMGFLIIIFSTFIDYYTNLFAFAVGLILIIIGTFFCSKTEKLDKNNKYDYPCRFMIYITIFLSLILLYIIVVLVFDLF